MKMMPVLFIIGMMLIAGYVVTDTASVTIQNKQEAIRVLDSLNR